jgi:predicted ArsR family transcriptional regulator
MADKTKTDTAHEVRRLLEAGLSVRDIAKVLDLSTQGVHWHLKKLGLRPVKK